ncbi:MAG TPA: LLM class flavin-dependent oxidoreductase [Rhizobiaceae bacterium]|nr:LLM class flavin-dependent oxidoreductase [Rhizobiaceae bacterium]
MQIAFTAHPLPVAGQRAFFFNPDSYRASLRKLDAAGFSGFIVDDAGGLLSNLDLAADVGRQTSRLSVIATHWPGVMSPVISARQLAYLDNLVGGRLSLRMGVDQEAAEEGSAHERTCARVEEYLTLLKRLWSNDRPFDHEGRFYSIRNGFVAEKSIQGPSIAIRMSGRTGTAMQAAARHATIFELALDSNYEIARQISRVQAAARSFGREGKISFALSVPVDRIHAVIASGQPAAAKIAIYLLPFAELGISEFIITGFGSDAVMRLIGTDVSKLLANTLERHSEKLSVADGGDVPGALRLS